jgi:hypothetical protein
VTVMPRGSEKEKPIYDPRAEGKGLGKVVEHFDGRPPS